MPEIRKDPLIGRWVVFSPERLRRPMNASTMREPTPGDPESDPFSEGNESYTPDEVFAIRNEHSQPNKPGWQVRVVPNRFPALRVEGNLDKEAVGFYDRINGIGAHEVVIETPNAQQCLEDLKLTEVANVLKAYRARSHDLSQDKRFRYIIVFKNFGALAGASIYHSHSQIIALPITPITIKEKLVAARHYFLQKDRNIFEDILRNELKNNERLVFENAGFAAFCPFASRFPFEICIMPRQQKPHFAECDDHELFLLADAVRTVLRQLSEAVGKPDYNMIIHTAPIKRIDKPDMQTATFDYRWHVEILPRLTGIAGFEFGTGFHINTVLPEEAATILKEAKIL